MSYPPPSMPPPSPSGAWQSHQPRPAMPGLRMDGSTKGPNIWIGIVIVAIAVVMMATSLWKITDRIGDFTDSTAFNAPGTTTIDLVEGEWRLFRADDQSPIDVSSIEVSGPAPVEFRVVDSTDQFVETRNVGDDRFSEIAAFDVDEDGDYTFDSTDATDGDADLLVARSTSSLFESAIAIGGWSLLGLFGGLVFLLGLIPLIMSLVNRSRAKRSREYLIAIGQAPPNVID